MRVHVLVCFSVLTLLTQARAGFNWGDGCDGGGGNFTVILKKGELAALGVIPKGKWNVEVRLAAPSDMDIQIYDKDDVSKVRRFGVDELPHGERFAPKDSARHSSHSKGRGWYSPPYTMLFAAGFEAVD